MGEIQLPEVSSKAARRADGVAAGDALGGKESLDGLVWPERH
jgi:hypothetical protein